MAHWFQDDAATEHVVCKMFDLGSKMERMDPTLVQQCRARGSEDDATEHIDIALESTGPSFFQQRRAQWRAIGLRLWDANNGAVLGRDDSLLQDGDVVYVVNHHPEFVSPMEQIDYFHGLVDGIPMAQMCDADETDLPAHAMISQRGCFAKAVVSIQRLFGTKRTRRVLVDRRLLPPCLLRHRLIQYHVASYIGRSFTATEDGFA
jgi:hypothetical protein